VVTGVNLGILAQKGSLYVTRPTLATYANTPERLQAMADELFAMIGRARSRWASASVTHSRTPPRRILR